jgi:hypothetical protein
MAWLASLELADEAIGAASSLALPWETGVMACIFGDGFPGSLPNLLEVALPEIDVVAAIVRSEPVAALPRRVEPVDVQHALGLAYRPTKRPKTAEGVKTKEDRLRSKYINSFAILILGCGESSDVGRQLAKDTSGRSSEEILADVLFSRRTATIGARLQSLLSYSDWLACSRRGLKMLPFDEQMAYEYVVELQLEKAPPTRATRFREAVAFAKYVLGADGAMAVLVSVRTGGAALRSFVKKKDAAPTRPAAS